VVGKRAGAPAGSSVTFELTGPAARTIHVAVGDRARVVDELPGPATVTLTMPAGVFARLAAGRGDPEALGRQVTIDGDSDLGRQIVTNMRYTM
jgi:ubiquinone biosynthesis protein UbiJ